MFESTLANLLVDTALRSLLVAAAVWLALKFSAKGAAGLRHTVWTTVLLLLLVMPLTFLVWTPNYGLLEGATRSAVAGESARGLSFLKTSPAQAPATNDDQDQSLPENVGRPLGNSRESAAETAIVPTEAVARRSATSGRAADLGLPRATVAAPPTPPWSLLAIVAFWLAGSLAVAGTWWRSRRALKHFLAQAEGPSPEVTRVLRSVARLVGYRQKVRICVSENIGAPAVTGILRPCLILPKSLVAAVHEDFFQTLVAHELIHLRRRDPLVQGLGRLAATVYWFNPFVWLARSALEVDRELLTDAEVVRGQKSRVPYAEGLLRVLKGEEQRSWQPLAALGLFDGSALNERMKRIIDGELVPRAGAGIQILAIIVCCSLGCLVSDLALAREQSPATPEVAATTQDEEKVEATIRVRIIPPSHRQSGAAYAVKNQVLGPKAVQELLARYSVDHDQKYGDGRGLSSTRVIIENEGSGRGDELKFILVSCANLKIYRIEIVESQGQPEPQSSVPPLVLEMSLGGEVSLDGEGLFNPKEDPEVFMAVLKSKLAATGRSAIHLKTRSGTPISYMMPIMDLARQAGVQSMTFSVDDSAATRLDSIFRDDLRERVDQGPKLSELLNQALDYLASQQQEDGRITDAAGDQGPHDQGRTALALMAFLGTGHSHRAGEYQDVVKRGLTFLVSQQQEDGFLGSRLSPAAVYGHAIAGLVLSEAYAITKDGTLKPAIQAALNYSLQAQNPYRAWRYQPANGENDSSITSWMMMFLKSAETAGFEVPAMRWDWALGYLEEVTDPETGRVGYTRRGDLQPASIASGSVQRQDRLVETTTAMATFIRGLCDPELDAKIQGRARALMMEKPPVWSPEGETVDYFYWYFGTLSAHQAGGAFWERWEPNLRDTLNQARTQVGPDSGSWASKGRFGVESGRVATTALAALALEVCHHRAALKSDDKAPK